jgi:hypothetical protein
MPPDIVLVFEFHITIIAVVRIFSDHIGINLGFAKTLGFRF